MVWRALENHFQKPSWANQFALRKKLYSLRMDENSLVSDHIKTVTEIMDNLTAVGDGLHDKDRVMILLSGLPSKFDVLITTLQTREDLPNWREVVEQLAAEETRQSERNPQSAPGMVFYSSSEQGGSGRSTKREMNPIICFHCGRKGHIRRNCFIYKKEMQQGNRGNAGGAAVASDGVSRLPEATGFLMTERVACCATDAQAPWILDSGATSHMTCLLYTSDAADE